MFVGSPSQSPPTSDDVYAQLIHVSDKDSSDSSREYFPRQDSGEEEDEIGAEEASMDVEQQTQSADHDRDRMSSSQLSSTPKTHKHSKNF